MDLFERYTSGQQAQVWHELRRLGDRVREPEVLEQAQAVCDEMARRARRNIELIIGRLRGIGYEFFTNDDERKPIEPLAGPTAQAQELVRWLEHQIGPVPLAVSSWMRIVGDVWLVGAAPGWPDADKADPLVIQLELAHYEDSLENIQDYLVDDLEDWREYAADSPEEAGLFVLPVGPDRLTKANISGGPPYGIIMPDGCAEGLFSGEVAMPFVSYLNAMLGNGGFLGAVPYEIRKELTRGIELL